MKRQQFVGHARWHGVTKNGPPVAKTGICYLSFKVLSRFYFPSLPIFETESLTGGMHKAKRDHEQPKEKYYGGDIGLEPLFWTSFSP